MQKLLNIIDIELGRSFRKKIVRGNDGNVFLIEAKDLKEKDYIEKSDLSKTYLDKIKKPINKEDIILSNRGYFKAAIMTEDIPVIASSSVYVLKIRDDSSVLPEYVMIYLNSKYGQRQLVLNTTGSMIKTILRSDLENITIPIPDIKTQKKIIEIEKQRRKIEILLNRKKILLSQISQQAIDNLITNKIKI